MNGEDPVMENSRENKDRAMGASGDPTAEFEASGGEQPGAESDGTIRLQESLNEKTAEAERYKDMYLRSLAEMDNLRKRAERDKSDLLKYGHENLMRDCLPVLDSFDKALSQADSLLQEGHEGPSSALSGYVDGVRLVKQMLEDLLRRHGLSPITAMGAKFDPNLHQAIQRIESDEVESEEIAQEFATGYTLNGRLVRPSMVSVRVPAKR